MTDTPSLPDYEDIAQILEQAYSTFEPSQVHGLLCGLICATLGAEIDTSLQKLIFPAEKKAANFELIEQLYEVSYHLLSEFSFEFDLLLPNISVDINMRTEALGLWCQGFLSGLQKGGIHLTQRGPGDVTDALNDLVEISQVSFGEITENDEDESAYFELIEHVRMSALMIFQEFNASLQTNKHDQGDSLH